MKPGSISWKRFMRNLRMFSRIVYVMTLVVFVTAPATAHLMIVMSGILLALNQFLAGFEPIREEPRWEYVYPELALGHRETEEIEKNK